RLLPPGPGRLSRDRPLSVRRAVAVFVRHEHLLAVPTRRGRGSRIGAMAGRYDDVPRHYGAGTRVRQAVRLRVIESAHDLVVVETEVVDLKRRLIRFVVRAPR